MKRVNAWIFGAVAIGAICLSAVPARAEWKPFKVPTQEVTTLIITGNYARSRLLAELIQVETKQPILLIPAKNHTKIYFMPPKNRGEAVEIPEKELTNFIRFIDPRQVLVLGDDNYVPYKYRRMVNQFVPVWVIYGQDWERNAESIGKLMKQTSLAGDYRRLLSKLLSEEQYWRSDDPRKNPSAATEEVVAEETVVNVAPDGAVTAEKIVEVAPAPATAGPEKK